MERQKKLTRVKMHTGVRDLQGSRETYRGGGLQSGGETYRGTEIYIRTNLQGEEKLTGGRKNLESERIKREQSLTGGEEAYRARG